MPSSFVGGSFPPPLEAVASAAEGIDITDPFVHWLTSGAFFYFDYKFDVIAINTLCFDEIPTSDKCSSINLGEVPHRLFSHLSPPSLARPPLPSPPSAPLSPFSPPPSPLLSPHPSLLLPSK